MGRILLSSSQSQIEQVEKDSRISKVGLKYGGENKSFQIKNPTSYKRGTAEMIIGDKSYFEMVLTGNFDGKVPANENEVAVEKDFLDKNGMKVPRLADKIVLTQWQSNSMWKLYYGSILIKTKNLYRQVMKRNTQ